MSTRRASEPPAGRSARRRLAVTTTLLGGLLLVAVLFLFLYPIQTWAGQRRDLGDARERLELLRRENSELATDGEKLRTDAEIERLARERFGMVRPDEDAYAILPAAPTAPTTTSKTPTTPTDPAR